MHRTSEHIESEPKLNLNAVLSEPHFKYYQSIGLIDEMVLRNIIIREEYKQLRFTNSQLSAIYSLSQKHNLSFDSIHHILYRKSARKRILIHTLTSL